MLELISTNDAQRLATSTPTPAIANILIREELGRRWVFWHATFQRISALGTEQIFAGVRLRPNGNEGAFVTYTPRSTVDGQFCSIWGLDFEELNAGDLIELSARTNNAANLYDLVARGFRVLIL